MRGKLRIAQLKRLRAIASYRHRDLLAILSVVFACGFLMQGPGYNQNSHYALVKALSDGTPRIDRTRFEVGDLGTHDVSYYRGHYYSDKAPGLAFATLPPYIALKEAGVRTSGDPTNMLWALGLFGAVLPAVLTVLLVRSLAERVERGFGTVAAVSLGLGTLVFPFATLFFAHALSAFLGFAAFALLWREREGPPRLASVVVAGLLAGFAVTAEYALVLVATVLAAYAITRRPLLRRGLAYGGGFLCGVMPLLAYDRWAFGSVTRYSRTGALVYGHPIQNHGVFGVGAPSVRIATELLFTSWGLLTAAPILAAGVAGTVLLYRRGRRAETAVIGAVSVLVVAYDSGFFAPFGDSVVPRYLIPLLPFLAVPLALAFRAFPATTGLLAAASVALMFALTATHPLALARGHLIDRLTTAGFAGYSQTALSLVGITGGHDIVLFFIAVLFAGGFTIAATPRPSISLRETLSGIVAVAGWGLIALAAPTVLRDNVGGRLGSAVLVVLFVSTAAFAVALVLAWKPRLPLPIIGRRDPAPGSHDGAPP